RKRPDAAADQLANRFLASKKIRSKSRKMAALNDVAARLKAQQEAKAGSLTLWDYDILKFSMLPDDALPRRFRRAKPKTPMGSPDEELEKNARAEQTPPVPGNEQEPPTGPA